MWSQIPCDHLPSVYKNIGSKEPKRINTWGRKQTTTVTLFGFVCISVDHKPTWKYFRNYEISHTYIHMVSPHFTSDSSLSGEVGVLNYLTHRVVYHWLQFYATWVYKTSEKRGRYILRLCLGNAIFKKETCSLERTQSHLLPMWAILIFFPILKIFCILQT